MNRDNKTVRFVLLAVTLGGNVWVSAGELNPPAGPVQSTMLPLDQIEARTPISSLPFTIDQGGSYFLTGSLTGVSGSNGITVMAGDVTLDLNGFSLIGVPGSLDGIHVPQGIFNLTVRNGGVSFWKDDGVDASNAVSSVIENVRSYGNLGTGVKIGSSSTVRNSGGPNGGDGISTGAHCMIINCMANGSSGNGIVAGPANRVEGCAASFNGLNGIQAGKGSIVTSCAAANNFSDGISMAGATGCTVMGCTAVDNTGRGIRTGNGGVVVNCTVTGNGSDGILTGDGSTVSVCSAFGNFNGINGADVTIVASTAFGNVNRGITAGIATVAHCTATENGGVGIDCALAHGNTSIGNTGFDIQATLTFHNLCVQFCR